MTELPSHSALVAVLRWRFLRHNVHVVSMTAITLLVSIALWLAAYAASAWLTLLTATIASGSRGEDAEMPSCFGTIFVACATLLLGGAILRRRLNPDARPRDRKTWLEHALDVILAIPATTVAVWSNLTAWLWLDRDDLREAAFLIERVAHDKRLPLSSVPVEIPDGARREKVVLGLLLVGILDLRQEDRISYLRLTRGMKVGHLLGDPTLDAETSPA